MRKCFHCKRSQHLLWLAPEFLPPLPSFLAANKHRGFPQSLQVTTSWTLAAVTGTFCVSVSAVVGSRSQSGCCCRDGRSFSVVHSPHDSEKQCCCWHARSCSAQIELRRSTTVVDLFFFFFFSSCRKLRARVTRNREIKNSGLSEASRQGIRSYVT